MKKSRKPKSTPARKQAPVRVSPRLSYFQERKDAIVETIRQMVEIESPSDAKAAVDKLGRWLASKFEALGGHSKFHRAAEFGDHLQVDFSGRERSKTVLLVGHLYYVFPLRSF